MRYLPVIVAAITAFSISAQARPVSYAGGWMAMTMNDGMENSNLLSYSPTARDAIGVRSDYLRDDDAWMHAINYNRLLKRWNEADSQANIYMLSGAGVATRGDTRGAVGWLGMEADWESRRYYVGYENRVIGSGVVEESFMQRARVGVAPYIANYDGWHPWLMLQVDHRPGNDNELVVTPLLRVFNSEVLGEAGISSAGDVLFNVTTQF